MQNPLKLLLNYLSVYIRLGKTVYTLKIHRNVFNT